MSVPLTPRQSQQIEQILQALDQTCATPAANRRQRNRVALKMPLEATLLNAPTLPQILVHTRNISSSGMSFVCRKEFRIGEKIAIHLTIASNPLRLILAVAVFCRYVGGGHYEVGVSFQEAAKPGRIRIPAQWAQSYHGNHSVGAGALEPVTAA